MIKDKFKELTFEWWSQTINKESKTELEINATKEVTVVAIALGSQGRIFRE